MTFSLAAPIARLILASVWLVAGITKVRSIQTTADAIAKMTGIPYRFAHPTAWALPLLEICLGASLMAGYSLPLTAYLSAGLLLLFVAVILPHLLARRSIRCNCFGHLSNDTISWLTLVRNGIFVGLALIIASDPEQMFTFSNLFTNNFSLPTQAEMFGNLPVVLMFLGGYLTWLLIEATWKVGEVLVKVDAGPALGMPERSFLRRKAGLDEV